MPKHEVGGTNAVIGETTSGKVETIGAVKVTNLPRGGTDPAKRTIAAVGSVAATPVGPEEEVELSACFLDLGNHRLAELETDEHTKTLTETLAREGQQQNIRVTLVSRDQLDTRWKGVAGVGQNLRVVFGERRFKAAQLLKWKTIRANVSGTMSDLEIESVRAIENFARRDPELPEACAAVERLFAAVRADGKARGNDLSEEQACQAISARIGKAVSWVRDHLRIGRCRTSKKCWEYIVTGKKQKDGKFVKLPKQHAREIAKLSDPGVRDEVAEWVMTPSWTGTRNEMPRSIEDLRHHCSNLMHDLKTVPWELHLPVAGQPACVGCPSNSANDRALFEHDAINVQKDAAAGMCLNKVCFEAKRLHIEKQLKEQQAEATRKLKALPVGERTVELKAIAAEVPKGIRADTFRQVVSNAAAEIPAAAPSKKGKTAPKRLDKKDLGPSPKQVAERKLSEAREEWIGKVDKLVRDGVHDKPGRHAATALFLENPEITGNRSKPIEKRLGTPGMRKLIALTAAPTMAGIVALEKLSEEPQTATLFHLYEDPAPEVVVALAEAWALKLPPRPKLEDFMPKAGTNRGTCRVCGCTEDKACVIMGEGCSWVDDTQTLCSACVEKDPALLKALRAKSLKGGKKKSGKKSAAKKAAKKNKRK